MTTSTYDDTKEGGLSTISHKRGSTELSPWGYAYNPSGVVASETASGTGSPLLSED